MLSHSELVQIAAKWVKNYLKFPIIETELKCIGSREIPDILAFRSNTSLIVECKTSLADFRKDFKKPERNGQIMGVGNYRIYCAPKGMIDINKVPDSWGLIEVSSKGKVTIERFRTGNIYSSNNSQDIYKQSDPFFHLSDIEKERSFLYSILIRRMSNDK